jgi:ketosteroid isomerase-like protein
MKIRSPVALLALAIGFAVPTFAQEQGAVDPKTRQEIEAVSMQFVEAYNKHDAAATAALYTQDAVRVKDWSGGDLPVGRESIEKGFEKEFAASFPPLVRKLVQMYAMEDRILYISEYSHGPFHGHNVKIFVRDADTWKIRMEFIAARGW